MASADGSSVGGGRPGGPDQKPIASGRAMACRRIGKLELVGNARPKCRGARRCRAIPATW